MAPFANGGAPAQPTSRPGWRSGRLYPGGVEHYTVEVRMLAFLAVAVMARAQSWTPQKSGTTASLRGIAAVSDKIGWASGTGGTFLLTTNGGITWTAAQVPG